MLTTQPSVIVLAVHLVFLWLPSADFAVQRVADRVRMGGHNVPEATVRRRYERGLWNFFRLYQPLAASWRMYDNSWIDRASLIAAGMGTNTTQVGSQVIWNQITQGFGHGE